MTNVKMFLVTYDNKYFLTTDCICYNTLPLSKLKTNQVKQKLKLFLHFNYKKLKSINIFIYMILVCKEIFIFIVYAVR